MERVSAWSRPPGIESNLRLDIILAPNDLHVTRNMRASRSFGHWFSTMIELFSWHIGLSKVGICVQRNRLTLGDFAVAIWRQRVIYTQTPPVLARSHYLIRFVGGAARISNRKRSRRNSIPSARVEFLKGARPKNP
jgi:hypothetical protein